MKLIISDEAFQWFKREMEVVQGKSIRFYARYGGSSPFHEAFSLGMTQDEPHDIGVETVKEGIHFYIEKDDLWFFNDHNLHVKLDVMMDELKYDYIKE
ncbi:hypothetical protein U5N28_17260 [Lysinibacillus telephonicus]|uniref:FeS cluster biogenesis domain-containing protein n=1 Tax=Lysinibacillus telephonicus TaxID=1714840 RepID=A0A3S0KB96_9BACI|nr:hypothetical protein [Lysinibacillus telephonicus]RTQ86979.1 hypothetical protein EKG35_19560 [Lysinibacillus telephonicus]